ncbi:cobyric acid synthase [Sorangium cellulosum]|uniref:Cobyric acid synthase n=1 Tax=Sorangium cellulosum TaxID=56 RepID=A0A2L0EIK5_SORCE|nr:cobyric acid synthase [Sorangium cellulosum]AUX39132.1 cobyric acid synthase [Sorangium cellulosum]
MAALTVMVQGTASSVGKSLLCTALCRMFQRRGLRVAPFKSQNMALNSFATLDGGEIGRAQAVQAEAARVAPTVDMNPVLLKPEGDSRSQVVVLGKPIGSLHARDYYASRGELKDIIAGALGRLRAAHDVVVIEGAGSPAEINLKDRDIVNMHVARVADAPVLLAGDIDRGGVFAALVGTMALLDPDERARVAAFVINKFRGDLKLLEPGLEMLTARTGVPVLGVVPYLKQLRIADEDSVSLEGRRRRAPAGAGQLDIAVVRLPRISNYDDLEPLEHERGVVVRYIEGPGEIGGADLVVLPGTKSTMADLAWLRASGLAEVIAKRAREGGWTLGICGGCQMLGGAIEDPEGVESAEPAARGLGLLDVWTRFERTKTVAQVRARLAGASFLGGAACAGGADGELAGYEIHMGRVERAGGARAAFEIRSRSGAAERALDGAVSADGAVVGTMIHGIFENDGLRRSLLSALRERRGLPAAPAGEPAIPSRHDEYDRLATAVESSLDRALLDRIVGLDRRP